MKQSSPRPLCFALWTISLLTICAASPAPAYNDQVPLHKSSQEIDLQKTQNINLDFSGLGVQSARILLLLSSSKRPKDHIQKLHMKGKSSNVDWTLFASLLPQLSSLQELHWSLDQPIPKWIVKQLEESQPPRKLYYQRQPWHLNAFCSPGWLTPGCEDSSSSGLEVVSDSRALYSLTTTVDYGSQPSTKEMGQLFHILSRNPQLREFSLSIGHSGCIMTGGQPYAFDFLSHPGVGFPALEVLTLEGYRFEEICNGGVDWDYAGRYDIQQRNDWGDVEDFLWDYLPEVYIAQVIKVLVFLRRIQWFITGHGSIHTPFYRALRENNQTNLECWSQAMDWTQLHTLNLIGPETSTINALRQSGLPSLRNLSLTRGWREDDEFEESVLLFLSNTSTPLSTLSLYSLNFPSINHLPSLSPLATTISLHQPQIRNLTIHQPENDFWDTPTPIKHLTKFALSKLLETLPLLEALHIDMPRLPQNTSAVETNSTIGGGLLDENMLKILASTSESLSHLVLHFPSPDMNFGEMKVEYGDVQPWDREFVDLPDPLINVESVQALYNMFEGKMLKALEVLVGNWDTRNVYSNTMMGKDIKRVARYVCESDRVCQGQQTKNVR